MSLHALAYCERLFYLEEVEEIRVADHRVYAGRIVHEVEIPDDGGELVSVTMESAAWGLKGKLDYLRYRDGALVPYEHKRGRSRGAEAWASDRLQLVGYAVLLAEHVGRPIREGRVHYHANNKTVRIPIDDMALADLTASIRRARELAIAVQRPPVSDNENLCARCSLAPVCLPEEERLAAEAEGSETPVEPLPRLFPEIDERRVLHVTEPGMRVGKHGEEIIVTPKDGEAHLVPSHDVSAIVLHGAAQISSQAIHYCLAHDIGVHWLTGGGQYAGGILPPAGVQRRHRQFHGLADADRVLQLARRLTRAKVENQLRFLLRGARARGVRDELDPALQGIRAELRGMERDASLDAVRGHEGMAGRHYFSALPRLLDPDQAHMQFDGRNRRPPTDAFNAALSFGYALLYRDVMAAIITVGLDPAFGILHAPRSAAYPLALDLMELFRVTLWDMPLVAAINRQQWTEGHFTATGRQVWLNDAGRRLAIELYETRKQERWRHPVAGYSLSYQRAIELEARLLEKEWSGAPGLFARMRLRG
ncbi:MAG: type I-MYXAN CRISPR-associated endonuclease Cas1 [Betaproteobacteria bacterium]|nr:type I-MYXAN CRISPR-associated endonuclease Cas1 [Betaproteobacteria bacterium]